MKNNDNLDTKKEKKVNKIKEQLARLRAKLASENKHTTSPLKPKLKKTKDKTKQAKAQKKPKEAKNKRGQNKRGQNKRGQNKRGQNKRGQNKVA